MNVSVCFLPPALTGRGADYLGMHKYDCANLKEQPEPKQHATSAAITPIFILTQAEAPCCKDRSRPTRPVTNKGSVLQCCSIAMAANNIQYSEKYYDDVYEYR